MAAATHWDWAGEIPGKDALRCGVAQLGGLGLLLGQQLTFPAPP